MLLRDLVTIVVVDMGLRAGGDLFSENGGEI